MNELFRALPALLKNFDDNDAVREAVAFAAWKRIAGESLNQHAVAQRLEQKRLTVAVRGETWRKHLEQLSGQMIFKLNSVVGQPLVTFIEFTIDENAVDAVHKSSADGLTDEQREQIALRNVTPRMRAKASAIKDEALRERFLVAAGSCLERKKKMVDR